MQSVIYFSVYSFLIQHIPSAVSPHAAIPPSPALHLLYPRIHSSSVSPSESQTEIWVEAEIKDRRKEL